MLLQVIGIPNQENVHYLNPYFFKQTGFDVLLKPNDDMVYVSSIESQNYFNNLGHSKGCHIT